jgi:hypothetical protein
LEEGAKLQEMKELVAALPKENRALFRRLLRLLNTISANREVTKMGPSNLATVIGPNIIYEKTLNPQTMIEDMEHANSMLVAFITKYHLIFEVICSINGRVISS